MIFSLAEAEGHRHIVADVAVVGAGLVGVVIATEIARQGLKVVIVESGGWSQDGEEHPLNEVELLSDPYRGASFGRFRCLGGTSTRWGGALLPYLPEDLGIHTAGWGSAWGIDPSELSAYLPEVERIFGVQPGNYDDVDGVRSGAAERLPSFVLRAPKWPRFRFRNVATIFDTMLKTDPRLEVWLNATATTILSREGGVKGLQARSLSGNVLNIEATATVIACGAIESTRLLLLLARADDALGLASTPLGQYFHDHLSGIAADVETLDRAALNRMFSFRFVSGGMRNYRLELDGAARLTKRMPAAFAHISFSAGPDSGFGTMRRIYRSVQDRKRLPFAVVASLIYDLPWLIKAGWWRVVERAVLAPSSAQFALHLVTEQEPRSRNRITLSERRADPFGLPLAAIDWEVGEGDIRTFGQIQELLVHEWNQSNFGRLGRLTPRALDELRHAIVEGGGTYHPAGTTRIGKSPSTSVLDTDLAPHRTRGLFVVATSAFPSVGGANPGLSLLLLALRASRHIAMCAKQ